MGSPTLDLFIDSWNVQHPDNKLYKAKKTEDYSVTLPVKKEGFICAHTVFEPGFLYSKLHDYALASRIPEQKGMKLPPLIFAQSGAIYFEK